MKKQKIITVLGFIISITLLWLSLRGISFREIVKTLDSADYRLVFVPLIFVGFAVTGCAFRWSKVCGGKVRFKDTFTALLIGLFVNNVLPARIGELARGYVLSKKTGLSLTYSLSTVLADRFFDLVGLLAITFLFLPEQALPPTVSKAIFFLVALLIICIVGMILLSRKRFADGIATKLHRIKRPFFSKIAHRVLEVQENLKRINSPLNLLGFSVLSIANWLSMTAALYITALSLGVKVNIVHMPFVCALLNMGLTVPSSPGYIGVYQFLLTYLLMVFAVPKSEAFTVSLLFHAMWYIPYNIVGALLLIKENLKFKELQRVREDEDNA